MSRITYVIKRVCKMDYKALFKTVRTVHEVSGKNRVWAFFDVVQCGFKYGAGYKDYLLCEFYKLTPEQRATYVTREVNNTLVSKLNNREYYHIFDNKDEFYTTFGKYLGRGWLNFAKASQEEFENFMKDREAIITKPTSESCGVGVEKLRKSDFKDLSEMAAYLRSVNSGLIEDIIVQHEDISRINPESVNTLRMVTILSDDGPHIVYCYIRIGNSDRPVDNINAGGMCAPIDLDTGIIKYPGYDKDRKVYLKHPRTGCPIQGYQIPYWEESKKICLEAAALVPQMRYIGWDVAVTPTGPVFVEGNNFPGYDILQMPPHTPDRIGMLPEFRKYVKDL